MASHERLVYSYLECVSALALGQSGFAVCRGDVRLDDTGFGIAVLARARWAMERAPLPIAALKKN